MDEIRHKLQGAIPWMAMAIAASTCLGWAALARPHRDPALKTHRRATPSLHPIQQPTPAIAPRPLSPQASRKAPEADPPQATAPLYPPNETPPRPHGPTPEGRHTPTADPIGPHRPRPALRSPPGPGPPPPPGRRQPVELAADRPSAPAAGPIGSAARGRSPEDRPGNTGSPRGAQALLPARRGKRGAAPGASRGGAAGADAAPGRGPADRGVPHVGAVCRNGPAADDRTRRRGDCHARWKARTWSLAGAGGVWKATCSR
jgi:hypothetical protein